MKKKLYLATNIDNLNQLVKKDFKNFKADKLYKSAETLFQTGLGHLQDGDEERAYIFFVRFILIYDHLRNLKEDDGYTKKRLGSEYNTILDQLEKLKLSLTERYIDNKNDSKTPPPQIIQPVIDDMKNVTINYPRDYISCSELYGFLLKKADIVILDARTSDDYRQSSMKDPCCVNIPEEIIKSGLSANVLGKDVPNESKSQWDRRWTSVLTVLMDWSSTKETITASKLSILRDILIDWDPTMNNSSPLVVLTGGYLEWLQTYPMHCTNPDIVHEVQNTVLNDLLDLDIIEYPTTGINDYKQQPVIDRATKPKIPIRTTGKLGPLEGEQKEVPDLIAYDHRSWPKKVMDDDINKTISSNNDAIIMNDQPTLEEKPKPDLMQIDDDSENDDNKQNNSENQRDLLLIEAREKKKPVFKRLSTPIIPPRPNEAKRQIVRRVINSSGKNLGPGLTGLGNTNSNCYLNSVVQCLSNTPSILYYFLDKDYVRDINPNEGTCGYVARAFGNLIQKIWSGGFKAFVPKEMKSAVYQFAPRYKEGAHQDAHEFMIALTNWLHEDLQRDMVRPRQVVWTPKQRSFIQQTSGKTSIILETFCGQIKNSILCEACGKVKDKFEIFENLTLALPSCGSCSLEECLQRYFGKQPITGYRCPQCQSESDIYQKATVVSFPPVLVLQLNRFTEKKTERGVSYQRNDIEVDFPKQLSHIFGKNYKLYATVNHRGSLEFGHYVAMGRNPVTERWYRVIYHELVQTTKEYMREVTTIDPKWLVEFAPAFFKFSDLTKLSKFKKNQRLEPLYNKYEEPNAWRISRVRRRRN
ncbi:Ubiquitin specific protease 8 [Carabus blaptoides fortunei]